MCDDMKDYDVELDAQLYDNDFDLVDIENQHEENEPQTDILFE